MIHFNGASLAITPMVHPRRWDLDDPKLASLPLQRSKAHPLLVSILAPRVPRICQETASFSLRYLESGGHSVKTRKSLQPLLKPIYFTRLKMRPWFSRFPNRRHRHSSRQCLRGEGALRSEWWRDYPHRPNDRIFDLNRVRVPLRSFSCKSEYASNYELWCTYRYALLLLPILLANAPPDSQLASISANCIFNSFCTVYPRETRKAKRSIAHYLSRCQPIKAMPSATRSAMHRINAVDVD